MRRYTGTWHTDNSDPTSPEGPVTGPNRRPSPPEIVALVDGMTASVCGAYLMTSSVLVTVVAGVLAAVVATLHLVLGTRADG
ncbi:hypothetical protein ABZ442_21745 [Streptomyces triculaminicus]|uniref:hypothetical protein n=1 Tax=Streptomyces triculaminicus TaxID=2816232 RepID=UPI003411E3C9